MAVRDAVSTPRAVPLWAKVLLASGFAFAGWLLAGLLSGFTASADEVPHGDEHAQHHHVHPAERQGLLGRTLALLGCTDGGQAESVHGQGPQGEGSFAQAPQQESLDGRPQASAPPKQQDGSVGAAASQETPVGRARNPQRTQAPQQGGLNNETLAPQQEDSAQNQQQAGPGSEVQAAQQEGRAQDPQGGASPHADSSSGTQATQQEDSAQAPQQEDPQQASVLDETQATQQASSLSETQATQHAHPAAQGGLLGGLLGATLNTLTSTVEALTTTVQTTVDTVVLTVQDTVGTLVTTTGAVVQPVTSVLTVTGTQPETTTATTVETRIETVPVETQTAQVPQASQPAPSAEPVLVVVEQHRPSVKHTDKQATTSRGRTAAGEPAFQARNDLPAPVPDSPAGQVCTIAPAHDGGSNTKHPHAILGTRTNADALSALGVQRPQDVVGNSRDAALPTTSPD
ncbi:hypothetical protein FHX82_000609 [Amycolatopsis bartoniae]|nr:hypothetical protein [Amycolatopsis bartoniae]MBB2933589.1 hypothetical protein [Amycolatopsis bartoniae]